MKKFLRKNTAQYDFAKALPNKLNINFILLLNISSN